MTVPAQAQPSHSARSNSSPKPGAWVRLGLDQGGSTATLLHLPNGNDLVVWQWVSVGVNKQHYEAVQLKPTGGMVGTPKDIFGGNDWGGVGQFPVLVSQNQKPLLIFEGSKADQNKNDPYNDGCIVGDLLTGGAWKPQPWSLSSDCVQTDHLGATITRKGTLSAPFAFGNIHYHIGASPSIPASAPDQIINTPESNPSSVGAVTETLSQHIFAAWDQSFSQPPARDGLYVADLTKKSKPVKAPDTGTTLVGHQPEPVSIASPTVRGGIYVVYCNNAWPCTHIKLWKYGAKRAVTVPQSGSNATSEVVTAGPSGRLWIAWWTAQNGTVRVVRTNEAGNQFGPVETYAGPHGCQSDGNGVIDISGGSQQRADVAVGCYGYVSRTTNANQMYVTQSLVPLQIAASTSVIKQRKGGKVTYRVSDVGDPVQDATVTVDGKKGTTDKKGQVTFQFHRGMKTGSFKVVASIANYLNASTFLDIT